MNVQINALLSDRHFQAYAAAFIRSQGLEPGPNPGALLLSAVRDLDPAAFPARVQAVAQNVAAYSARHEQMTKLEASLPPAQVAEAWRALPANSRLRREGKHAEFDALAKARGVRPLPGMTAGETLAAYIHAVTNHPELSTDAGLAQLAEATGNRFGDAASLRRMTGKVGDWGRLDSAVEAISEKQRQQETQKAKANGIKPPTKERQEKEKASADRRNITRDELRRQFEKYGPQEERVYLRDKGHAITHLAYDKASGRKTQYEISPKLRSELVEVARDENALREAAAPAGEGPDTQ